jgi:ABC-type multidrug transport system fused ATPase/permease subunit
VFAEDDVDAVPSHSVPMESYLKLFVAWEVELCKPRPSLLRAYYAANTKAVWLCMLYSALESTTRIGQPIILGYLLRWFASNPLQEGGSGMKMGYFIAAIMVLVSYFQVIIHHQLYYHSMRLGWTMKLSTCSLLHHKALHIDQGALASVGTGHVLTLISSDGELLQTFGIRFHFLLFGLLDVVVIAILLAQQVTLVLTQQPSAVLTGRVRGGPGRHWSRSFRYSAADGPGHAARAAARNDGPFNGRESKKHVADARRHLLGKTTIFLMIIVVIIIYRTYLLLFLLLFLLLLLNLK